MEQKEDFQILYDGKALQNHEMDVKDLAPALLAVGDLLEETNRVLYGDVAVVQVNVKGSFKTGSFHVFFTLSQSLSTQINAFFNSENGITTVAILSILGINAFNGFGLIPFILWVKGRKIKKITKLDDGKSSVEVDEEHKVVEDKVLDLYQNLKVRKSLDIVIRKPLEKDGVEEFAIKYKEEEFTTVNKEESKFFKTPDVSDELLKDDVREVFLTALSVSFIEDNKWRFTDGNVSFFASVRDEKFLSDVEQNKDSFSKDDLFKVKLREKQWIADNGIRTEYEIVEVINHRSAAKQIKLPFDK